MAKTVSPIFKFQGTIDDLTFVNSKRYKSHVRKKKHSKTPFVMTAPSAESKVRIQQCNQYARPVFQALRAESHDGGLWSRLVRRLFAELKAGRPLNLECLKGFECNLQHPMGEVIDKGYDLSATVSQNQLGIYVQLHGHPKVDDSMPRTGYQLRFIMIIPDAANGTVKKVEVLGPLTKYKDELTAHDLPIALPGKGAPYLLLMGIVPHLQGEGPARIMSDSGMRVVWVGGGRQAASSELRASSGGEDGLAGEEASGSGNSEVVALTTDETERVAAGERHASSSRYCGTSCGETSWEPRATSRRQAVCSACQSPSLVPTNAGWNDSVKVVCGSKEVVSESKEKGENVLLIDAAGDLREGVTAGAGHEEAFALPFKEGLAGSTYCEDGTLLNSNSYRDSGSHEVILHNNTFTNEEIAVRAACSIPLTIRPT